MYMPTGSMGNLTAKISTNDYNLYNEKNTYYNDTILARDTRKRNSEVLEINKRITMDVFQRSGRGGAGNFHHKDASTTKNLEAQHKDSSSSSRSMESQRPLTPTPGTAPANTSGGGMVRSGRGGAGNFSSSEAPTSQRPLSPAPSSGSGSAHHTTPAPTSTSSSGGGPVFSGRGGAGNFQGGGSSLLSPPGGGGENATKTEAEKEEERDGLAGMLPQEPPPIHLSHIRGKGRIPTEPDMQ